MKPLLSWLYMGLGCGLFFLFCNFLFNGLGVFSRVSSRWDRYRGGMSWSVYHVTLRPQGQAPASELPFATLRYGFTLAHHVQLKAQLLQSEIPLADMGPLLYDTTRFARFSPDSVYYAWVGLRGNAFSFAVGAKPAFVVLKYSAVAAAGADVPSHPVHHDWRGKWQLYAWAALSLEITFMLAAVGIHAMAEERTRATRAVALLYLLLFAAAGGYVDWCDYTTGDDWSVMTLILALGMLITYVFEVISPESEPEETPPTKA